MCSGIKLAAQQAMFHPQNFYTLIISDNLSEVDRLRDAFERAGYRFMQPLPLNGAAKALQNRPDLIIIDLGLYDDRGLVLLRRWREDNFTTPVVVLCSDDTEGKVVEALDLGGDIVIKKPYSVPELLARVRRRLQKVGKPLKHSSEIVVGELALDVSKRRVYVEGRHIPLTSKEFDLLELMARNPGSALSQTFLLSRLWKPDTEPQLLRAFIRQLRCKIERCPGKPRYIKTLFGFGYVLSAPAKDKEP